MQDVVTKFNFNALPFLKRWLSKMKTCLCCGTRRGSLTWARNQRRYLLLQELCKSPSSLFDNVDANETFILKSGMKPSFGRNEKILIFHLFLNKHDMCKKTCKIYSFVKKFKSACNHVLGGVFFIIIYRTQTWGFIV